MTQVQVRTANLQSITVGKLIAKYSVDGSRVLRYFLDFWHKELSLHKELSAPDINLLQGKIDALMAAWDKKLAEHQRRSAVVAGKDVAEQMTLEATAKLDALSSLLLDALKTDPRINWEALKDRRNFNASSQFPTLPPRRQVEYEPQYAAPEISFWDILLGRKGRKISEAELRFQARLQEWKLQEERNAASFATEMSKWNSAKAAFEADWERRRQAFLSEQSAKNARVDALVQGVGSGETQSVVEFALLVLERSDYGDLFEKSCEVDYVPAEKTLLVEYELPSPDHMPRLKAARFAPATGELRETYISEREQKANYDATCYQICLRTLHELFGADQHRNFEKILFNGSATYVDRTTGRDTTNCIMSVLVKRSDFEVIDLRRVDPKACFKSLKGVSASTLSALAAIPPVMELNKEDRRFVDPRNAADAIGEATNLAAMDWNDFEHLVRELFEKEFASRGGEVKITQASADGGVDAVAFDPDPITGGKIVIQAKRYTRTVGVSAVRDLYGTMQHEGASRGILITTADYGPDAYQFASGKPITLFTGANLLYLLEKHGYRAKIDLRDARRELNLRDYG